MQKNNRIALAISVVYVLSTLLLGLRHEPWFDRTQGRFALKLDGTPDYRMAAYLKGRLWYKTVPNPEIEDYCIFVRE